MIEDLKSNPSKVTSSPAHFNSAERLRETNDWKNGGIKARSYATVGPRPPGLPQTPEEWRLLCPSTYPHFTETADFDVTYRACYAACAGGPGQHQLPHGWVPKYLNPMHEPLIKSWLEDGAIQPWDNDGIVNTASMLWPPNGELFLVPADHMDIVGHFELFPAGDDFGLRHDAYDLLRSRSEFSRITFQEVWHDIFAFSC